MKAKEIKEFSIPELDKKIRDMRDELKMLNIRKGTGQVENTGRIRAIRRDIARFETIKVQKRNS